MDATQSGYSDAGSRAPSSEFMTHLMSRMRSVHHFDAAKTLRVRAATALRLCPRAPALVRASEKRHIHVSIPPRPRPPFILERRLTHPQLVSYKHTTSRSRLLSAGAPEWKRLKRVGRRSDWLSDSLDLSISHAGNPSSPPATLSPPDGGRALFCGDGGVDLRADDGTLSFSPRIASLPCLPRALAGACSSHRPHTDTLPAAYLDSRAAPGAAPPTCVQLASMTAALRPRFRWDGYGYELARARSLSHPYRTRARSLSRAYFVVRAPSHVCAPSHVRARLLATVPPPISPRSLGTRA
ncbi:hypothetical protein C8F04DRAFT_1319393 [Mycena alexandri]|uniref:Uncharacterized protein n=1 Tax=Mycena alexandri TaxID=1745969 RepID=A0AAD6WP74_9AGAR|nr:hypothetical protein C8F04DRAFT_1319393 [Mycena alexandri]